MKHSALSVGAVENNGRTRLYRRRRIAFSLCVGMLSPFLVIANPGVGAQGGTDGCGLEGQACIEIEKAGVFLDENGDGFAQVGETIFYRFAVTNTGTVELSNVVVDDPLIGLNLQGTAIPLLAPGSLDATSFTGSYEISSADISAGNVSNRATVVATTPEGVDIADVSDDPSDSSNVDPEGDGEPDDVTRVTLNAPNPSLNPDSTLDNPAGSIVTVDVLANDISFAVDPSSVLVIDPATGAADSVLAVAGEGDWLVSSVTGAITFFPEPGFTGNPTPIMYQAADSSGVVSAPVEVVVTYADGESGDSSEESEDDDSEDNNNENNNSDDNNEEGDNGEIVELEPLPDDEEDESADAADQEGDAEQTDESDEEGDAAEESDEPEQADDSDESDESGESEESDDTEDADQAEDAGEEEAPANDGDDADESSDPRDEAIEEDGEEVAEPVEIDDIEELDQPAGVPVDLDVVAVEEDVDPATIELVDPETGEPVGSELVIPGEGVATVDEETGVITFTPDPELEGDPSPLEFIAVTVLGEVVTANAMVTFEEPVQTAPAAAAPAPAPAAQSAETTTTTTTTTTVAPTTTTTIAALGIDDGFGAPEDRPELAFTGVKEDLAKSAILALASGIVAYILSTLAAPVAPAARKEDYEPLHRLDA